MTVLDDTTERQRFSGETWTAACPYDHLIPNRGVGVLLDDGSQAALFRLDDGSLYAIGNIDPFTQAAVMSRGIVGDRAGQAMVQSPIGKQAFGLADGQCLDDPTVAVPVYPVRVTPGGHVYVGRPAA
ncbi:nitrite reductase small subunit NirD [Mycobacterium botniense]|uniref:Nitrite reductase small subunit n=1 Tax=Mycobacterium botniense TaxID=84962 RepID=A0A7I9XW35_9MYCO|nr:nitrite reductase small subunit NirD [Mycobacterium botniense]GFG73987.1 nitrite reductase small subunit [Mycobacterium botniense]